MTFDQVRVIAVHRPNEVADCGAKDGMHAPGQLVGLSNEGNHLVLERARGFLGHHWLHERDIHAFYMPVAVPDVYRAFPLEIIGLLADFRDQFAGTCAGSHAGLYAHFTHRRFNSRDRASDSHQVAWRHSILEPRPTGTT